MRQAGIIAAGALHSLRHHRARLADDHENAQILATKLHASAETNIVNIDVDRPAVEVVAHAKTLGVLLNASGPKQLRAVTHLDVSRDDVVRAAELLARAIES